MYIRRMILKNDLLLSVTGRSCSRRSTAAPSADAEADISGGPERVAGGGGGEGG